MTDIPQPVFQQFLITDSNWGTTLIKSTDSQKNSVLHVTARENDLSAMEVLMEHKVESSIKNAYGKTPMHLAAEMGHHQWVAWKLNKINHSIVTDLLLHEM